jgi:Tfp pilus assembly protein PilN
VLVCCAVPCCAASLQIQVLQDRLRELPRVLQELQAVHAEVEQLQASTQQLAALKTRVAELQAEVRMHAQCGAPCSSQCVCRLSYSLGSEP